MRRYTTPFQELFIAGVALEGCDVYVTFADLQGNVIVTLDNATVVDSEIGSTITARMTQEQSILFTANQEYQIQVNWMDGNDRYATCISRIRCQDNLLKEIL